MDLSGWTVSDAVAVRHRFGEGVVLPPFSAVVVYGGPREGVAPQLNVPAFPASEGVLGLALNNSGGDRIELRNAGGHLIDRVAYLNLASDGSLARSPDLDSDFVPHRTSSALSASPGLTVDGGPFEPSLPEEASPVNVRVILRREGGLDFFWAAEPGRSYSVLEASEIDASYVPIASGITFDDQNGEYSDTRPIGEKRFYRVSTP